MSDSAYNKAYYELNKEAIKKRARVNAARRRLEKPEECKAAVLEWYSKPENKEKRKEYFKDYSKTEPFKRAQANWRTKNKESTALKGQRWRKENPDKNTAKSNKYRCELMKRIPAWLDDDDY